MSSAASFVAWEAIRNGEWDRHLTQLLFAIKDRRQILNPGQQPTLPKPDGTVWVWMNGPGSPHWEPRGTGLVPE